MRLPQTTTMLFWEYECLNLSRSKNRKIRMISLWIHRLYLRLRLEINIKRAKLSNKHYLSNNKLKFKREVHLSREAVEVTYAPLLHKKTNWTQKKMKMKKKNWTVPFVPSAATPNHPQTMAYPTTCLSRAMKTQKLNNQTIPSLSTITTPTITIIIKT